MKKERIAVAVLIFALAFCCVFAIVADAGFGSGVAVIAEKTEIIKTGISGSKLVFSDLDIKQGLCITDFDEIKIKSIPDSTEGTLMLAGRRVGVGTSIKRKNIGALVFIPASRDISECKFTFTVDEFADGAEIDFILKFTEKVNYAPKVDGVSEDTSVSTQRDVRLFGEMSGTDAEGDTLCYVIIKYPEVGSIKVLDENSGEFVYTPPADYTGEDSFTYVARDEWGNFSKPCEVSISVTERLSEVVYTDMKNHKDYNAAVALTAVGAVDGRLIGDGVYFCPDDTVTKAEFLTMAMKCAGVSVDSTLTGVYFDDADKIPAPMMSYVATAAKMGIAEGYFNGEELLFSPNSPITKYEAAMIMSALTDVSYEGEIPVFKDTDTFPVFASDAIYEMCYLGVFDSDSDLIEANAVLTKCQCVSYLYKMMSVS